MVRKLMVILLPLCILYFIIGAILLWLRIFPIHIYLGGAGIVGGIASVLGLLSFIRPLLTTTDLQNIEAESLQKLGQVSADLRKLEKEQTKKADVINNLDQQKKEMELLVRKACMSLFLKEQFSRHEKIVIDHLNGNCDYVFCFS